MPSAKLASRLANPGNLLGNQALGRLAHQCPHVAATVTSVVAGHAADRRPPRIVLAVGAAGFAIAYLGFMHDSSNWLALAPWFVLAGIGIGCAETAQHAAVAHAAPNELRGSAFGLLAAIQSFGNLAASSIAGILWAALSPSWAFGFLATAMIIATALIARSPRVAGGHHMT